MITFASDNSAGVHPAVMDALAQANHEHALGYGEDEWTARLRVAFNELFGSEVLALPVWNGTGANVLALMSMLGPAQAVVCSDGAHINVDETGAPERILGAKLIDLPTPDGKLTVPQVRSTFVGPEEGVHHVHPGVLSITQSTELGTLYTIDEIRSLSEVAHELGMGVHLDGARLANAVAALGGGRDTLRAMTIDAGVDVISFGFTKNGGMYGEVVVWLNDRYTRSAGFLHKQITQLSSKMRYLSAQALALLEDDLWLTTAGHANAMASRLYESTRSIEGVTYDAPPAVNAVFPILPREAITALREEVFFWDWDASRDQVRWMTAWDTTEADVDAFAARVATALKR